MPYLACRAKNVHADVIDLTIPLPFLRFSVIMETHEDLGNCQALDL